MLNFLRGPCVCTFHLVLDGSVLAIETFSIVCVSNAQACYSSILSPLRPHFSRNFFLYFILLQLFSSNCLWSFFPPTYFTHQTHSDGTTPSPLLSPYTLYLQSCDGTVCPDHVGLCIILTQIYPTMTNPPISICDE